MFPRLLVRPALAAATVFFAAACVEESLVPRSETTSRVRVPQLPASTSLSDRHLVAFKTNEPRRIPESGAGARR